MKTVVTTLGFGAALTFAGLASGQTAPAPAAQPAKPAAATPAAQVAPDAVVLTVGDEKITKSQFEAIIEAATATLPPERRAAVRQPEAMRNMAEQLAELKALAQEGRRQKLDQTPDAKTQLSLKADELVASLLFQNISKASKPAAPAMQAYYDEHKGDFETVTARHILIRMKDSQVPVREGQQDLTDEQALAKAKDLKAKIVAGGNFEELAKANSDDTGSGANGGALGEFGRHRMVPAFEEAAFKLKVDEVSDPVKTQFGYHIIQVTKHTTKTLAEAQTEIEQKLSPEAVQKAVDAVKAKTAITYDQAFFGK